MADKFTVVTVLISVVCPVICRLCPDRNTSAPLQFTTETNTQDFVRSGDAYQLTCCATGFKGLVEWRMLQKSPSPQKWVSFPRPNNAMLYSQPFIVDNEDGQVLVLLKAGTQYETNFTCVARNETSHINKTIELFVIDCDHLHGEPLVIQDPQDVAVDLGSDVTLTCGGYFGCYDTPFRQVAWMLQSKNASDEYIPPNQYDARYTVNTTYSTNKTKIMAELNIENVQSSDIGINFTCLLGSTSGEVFRDVRLNRIVPPPEEVALSMIAGVSVGCSVGGLAFILAVGLLVYIFWGPQIKFFMKRRAGRLLKPIGQNFDYDVALVSADEDQSVASDIEKELKHRRYRVFGPSDVPPGYPVGTNMRSISKSAVHAFLHSENTKMDTMTCFLFGLVTSTVDWDNLHIVLIYMDDSHKTNVSVRWSKAFDQFREEHNDIDTDNGDQTSSSSDDERENELRQVLIMDNRRDNNAAARNTIPDQVWNKFTSVQWPRKDCSQRQKENFFSDLQSHLPEIRAPID